MNRFLITALILFIGTLSVNAQTISSAEVKASVAKVLENGYNKMTNGDVEVKVTGTPFAQLQLPDGSCIWR